MRRVADKFPYNYKSGFEYYASEIEPFAGDSNPASRYESFPQTTTTNRSFTSPSSGSYSVSLTNQERKHYKKALKDIYKTVKIKSKKLDTDSEISEGYTQSDTEKLSSQTTSESPKSGERAYKFHDSRDLTKKRLTEEELQEVYQELRVISDKLKDESRELHAWEQDLHEREAALKHRETGPEQELLNEDFQDELQRRCAVLEEEYQDNLDELEKALHEKSREANRLRDSFNTIRSTHEELRKQFLDVQDQNKVLERQTLSLQQRLNNLLRKNEHKTKQQEDEKLLKLDDKLSVNVKRNKDDSVKLAAASKVNLSGILDVLASLLIWISDSQLDHVINKPPDIKTESESENPPQEHVYGKCVKILPPLGDLLSCLPTVNPNVMCPLLKFIYSVILYMDKTRQTSQKPVLTATLRRIGDELYKPEVVKESESLLESKRGKRAAANIYLRSSNLDERMLSTLIVLKTISQADYLSHTFDVLKSDLRDDAGKRLFILHNGIRVVLPFLKQRNKTILEYAVDVILQMSMESSVVSDFLQCSSTSDFFNVCTSLLQEKGIEIKILEKISIVVQRLSKIRSNRRYFEAFQLTPLIQDLLRQHDTRNAFLSLNMRSILVNLNAT